MKVLFLTAWYPHRYDAMAGLFVRKHAEAVSRFAEVEVLYVHFDKNVQKSELVENNFGKVRELAVYIPEKGGFFGKIANYFTYFSALFCGLKRLQKPDIVQVNVIGKHAFAALWLKRWRKIPFVVVEHFSRYLPQNFGYKGFWNKRLSELVAKKASCVLPVSKILGDRMQELGLKSANYQQINNVVDDFFFVNQPKLPRAKKRILNVTCFDEKAKNVSGILRAIKELSKKRQDFELILIGTGVDYECVKDFADSLGFPEKMVQFTDEQTPKEVCNWLYQSDFLVQFSNFETAGVVISEALAVGLPIISTPVGIVPEVITSEIGKIVPCGNEKELLNALDVMLDNYQNFDKTKIREIGKRYNFKNVSSYLSEVYLEVLNESHR